VEKKKKISLLLIAIGLSFILLPGLVSSIGGGIMGNPYHTVSCEVIVQRYYDQAPTIQTISCSRRNTCTDWNIMAFGEYKGQLELQMGGDSTWQTTETGLGTWDPKIESYTISRCVADTVSTGTVRLYNGEGSEVLSSKSFNV
jgi:hypothetical protein